MTRFLSGLAVALIIALFALPAHAGRDEPTITTVSADDGSATEDCSFDAFHIECFAFYLGNIDSKRWTNSPDLGGLEYAPNNGRPWYNTVFYDSKSEADFRVHLQLAVESMSVQEWVDKHGFPYYRDQFVSGMDYEILSKSEPRVVGVLQSGEPVTAIGVKFSIYNEELETLYAKSAVLAYGEFESDLGRSYFVLWLYNYEASTEPEPLLEIAKTITEGMGFDVGSR